MCAIFCVYPKDQTTASLQPIYDSIKDYEGFKGYMIETDEDKKTVIEEIKQLHDGSLFIFLGHGTNQCLQYGNNKEFINNDNLDILNNKKVFLLSCYSGNFLESNSKNPNINISEFIGFGDLPSEDVEMISYLADYPDIGFSKYEEVAEIYTRILSKSIKDALVKTLNLGKNFKYLYREIKSNINREINTILIEKNISYYRALSTLLFELKNEMILKTDN